MVNSIIDGISIKLNETFGDTYAIYSEEVDQNFTEKCFFIEILNPMIRPFVGDRHLRVHPFDIRFFPIENNNKTAQILDVADELTQCLKYITVKVDEKAQEEFTKALKKMWYAKCF